jgi:23S rRNA pseudouridine2605 synthase
MSDNRNKGGRPPRKPGGDAARGSGPRKFGDKPRAPRAFGDKPDARPRKPRAEGEGFEKRAPRAGFDPKPREGALRRASGEGFGKRPPRDAADRPRAPRAEGGGFSRGPREGFEAKPRGESGKRPPREGFAPRRAARPAPAATESAHEGERIAKVMARVGLCSRRDAEGWIAEGRVAVNGKRLETPAYNVQPDDKVMVDGQPLAHRERTRLFLFHKPRGLVTTDKDPEGRQTVFDYLRESWPAGPRVVSVGRLDINTEGLLLLTNDGGLARVLELPATGWLRRYRVRANGETDQAQLDALMAGVSIDGVDYAGIEARLDRVQGANVWLTMGLREGKNREIKRVLEHLGLAVNRLIRMSFGPFQLGDLPEGAVEEVRTRILRDQLGPALAEEAGADFDGPLHEPERFDESAPRRAPRLSVAEDEAPAPRDRTLRPRGPRRHVSALRADRDAEMAAGDRKRVERAETADRKGRAVAVERIVPARAKAEPATTRNARRFKAERAEADGERPMRKPRAPRDGEEARGPRRFEAGPPRRAASGGDRPARRPSRPARDFDDTRPRRERDGEGPQRRAGRADAPRGPRAFEGERPARRFDGDGKGARPRAGGPGGKPAGARPAGGPRGPKPGGFGGKPGGRPGGKPAGKPRGPR